MTELFGPPGELSPKWGPAPEVLILARFLCEIENVAPQVPTQLRDNVLPYMKGKPDLRIGFVHPSGSDSACDPASRQYRRIAEAKRSWERQFNLDPDHWKQGDYYRRFDWMIGAVLDRWYHLGADQDLLAHFWRQHPDWADLARKARESRDRGEWSHLLDQILSREWGEYTENLETILAAADQGVIELSAEKRKLIESYAIGRRQFPLYDPFAESCKDWRKRARAYAGRVEAAARQLPHGLTAIEKRNLHHFRWLARFQVGGEDYPDLADNLGTKAGDDPEGTLRKAVYRTAKLVGIKLRRSRRRPRRN